MKPEVGQERKRNEGLAEPACWIQRGEDQIRGRLQAGHSGVEAHLRGFAPFGLGRHLARGVDRLGFEAFDRRQPIGLGALRARAGGSDGSRVEGIEGAGRHEPGIGEVAVLGLVALAVTKIGAVQGAHRAARGP